MALRLTKSVFIHVPKTGGTWISAVLREKGIVEEETSRPHMRWSEILEEPGMKAWHHLRPFLFVRHPVSWYQSYWAYKVRNGWESGNWMDETFQSPHFPIFVENCVKGHPALLGRIYRKHTQGVSFVRRFEKLREGLLEALVVEGVSELPDVKPRNVSPPHSQCPPDLVRMIEESEAEVMKTWGYSSVLA